MRVLVQRSLASSVTVEGTCIGAINKGIVALIGFTEGDTIEDIEYCIHKLINLRIFEDKNGVMNESILDQKGSVLSISQFTLYASTEKGNRPSYSRALPASDAEPLYELWNQKLSQYIQVEKGQFGADMKVTITNHGPVTILIESRKKHD